MGEIHDKPAFGPGGVRASALVLALNGGSSSLKFALFADGISATRLLSGSVGRIGMPEALIKLNPGISTAGRVPPVSVPDHAAALDFVLEKIGQVVPLDRLAAAGHRVLHGGEIYSAPQIIDAALVAELKRLTPLGPEHLPAQISLIEAVSKRFPRMPQMACFDTAFHRGLPRVARLLPLPRRYDAAGVRRYGFHGLSYEFLLEELVRLGDPSATTGRIILAHLGNGASLAAVQNGRCIDTTMGFTPAAGLVMGRRTGDLDPSLPAYLAQTEGMTPEQFHKMVNHQSGLLGVSETTSDMRELLSVESSDPRAAEAIALFCYQAKKWAGAFTAALGGLDTLVFSGGIGENNPSIRARICDGFGFLGLELDAARNAANGALISASLSRVAVRVIPTDEELMIGRSTWRLLAAHQP